MPVNCDPFWSEQNGACSDEFGNYISPTGTSIQSWELSKILRGVQDVLTPTKGASTTAKPPTDDPPKPKCPDFKTKPLDWFECGNNALYVGGAVMAFVLLLVLLKGHK